MRRPDGSSFVYLISPLLAGLFLACGGSSTTETASTEPTAPESSPAIVFRSGVAFLDENLVSKQGETPGPEAGEDVAGEASAIVLNKPVRLSLRGRREDLPQLHAGRVFVHGNRAFQAQAVTEDTDGLAVEATEPALEDVIESLNLSGDVALTQKDLKPETMASSVKVSSFSPEHKMAADAQAAVVNIKDTGSSLIFSLNDFVVVDLDGNSATTYDRILANGNVTLDKPTISFDVKWKFLQPPTAKLNFHTGESAHLSISTPSYAFSKSYTVPIAGFQVPIPGTAGAATIGGKLNLVFSASGQVQASIVFDQFATVDAGLVGEGSPWKVKPYSTVASDFSITPSVSGSLSLGAFLNPRLSLLVLQYDVAGVYAKLGIEATASGVANLSQQCLNIGVDGKVAIHGYFKIPFYSVDKEIYTHTWPIYNKQFCAQ